MAVKGFIHINGTTYELADPLDQTGAATEIAERLKPSKEQPTDASQRQVFMVQQKRTQFFEVLIEGQRVTLTIDRQRVWASGAWAVEETGPQIF